MSIIFLFDYISRSKNFHISVNFSILFGDGPFFKMSRYSRFVGKLKLLTGQQEGESASPFPCHKIRRRANKSTKLPSHNQRAHLNCCVFIVLITKNRSIPLLHYINQFLPLQSSVSAILGTRSERKKWLFPVDEIRLIHLARN